MTVDNSSDPAPVRALPSATQVRTAYREEMGPKERAALWSWLGFTATFAAVRGITYSLRAGKGPFRNLSAVGSHLHHYM